MDKLLIFKQIFFIVYFYGLKIVFLYKIKEQKKIMFIISVISNLVSIIGFIISIIKSHYWQTPCLCLIFIFMFTFMSVYVVNIENKINRIENIHRAAYELKSQGYTNFTSEGFVQASLTFLETNKDLYPDTYTRALEIEKRMRNSQSIYASSNAASEILGIINGIAILNEEKEETEKAKIY